MKPLVYRKAKRVRHRPPVRQTLHVTKGDTVQVLSGDDKGRRGKVIRVYPKTGRVAVEGVNVITKHQRPTQGAPGGDHQARSAGSPLETDVDRPQVGGTDPYPPAEGRGRHAGADRGEVGPVHSEEPLTMAETKDKADKSPEGPQGPQGGCAEAAEGRQGQGRRHGNRSGAEVSRRCAAA